jgi:hypothetical protein
VVDLPGGERAELGVFGKDDADLEEQGQRGARWLPRTVAAGAGSGSAGEDQFVAEHSADYVRSLPGQGRFPFFRLPKM